MPKAARHKRGSYTKLLQSSSDYDSDATSDDSKEDIDVSYDEGRKNCCKIFRKKLWNFLRSFFIGYIPDNLYTIDFKLLFILTAMYTSLITQFRQAANQEADDDVDSGRLFKINSVWMNHSESLMESCGIVVVTQKPIPIIRHCIWV